MRSYHSSAEGAVAKRFLNAERNLASEAEAESELPPQPLAASAIALRPATAMALDDRRHASSVAFGARTLSSARRGSQRSPPSSCGSVDGWVTYRPSVVTLRGGLEVEASQQLRHQRALSPRLGDERRDDLLPHGAPNGQRGLVGRVV